MKRVMSILIALIGSAQLEAKTYIPNSESTVIAAVSTQWESDILREKHKILNKNPNNVIAAKELIREYMRIGKESSDPRYYGYAEAQIQAYLFNDKDVELQMLWAELLQHRHAFKQAKKLYSNIIRMAPQHAGALLSRWQIYITEGDYQAALKDCFVLLGQTSLLVSGSCLSYTRSLNGNLVQSYSALKKIISFSKDDDPTVQAWSYSLLADIALRMDLSKQAALYMQYSLRLDPKNHFNLATYADVLLINEEAEKVVQLLANYTTIDSLLLRLVLAQNLIKDAQAQSNIILLQKRYALAQRRGDRLHLRDLARFKLVVENHPQEALKFALMNWESQKESNDIDILLRCATATKDEATLGLLFKWIEDNKYKDKRLEKWL